MSFLSIQDSKGTDWRIIAEHSVSPVGRKAGISRLLTGARFSDGEMTTLVVLENQTVITKEEYQTMKTALKSRGEGHNLKNVPEPKAEPKAKKAAPAPAPTKPTKAPKAEKAPKTPKAPKAPAAPKADGKPRKAKIHGFSACAVAKALGKAGLKWEEADAIMRKNGIEMPKASLSVQLGFGRRPETWERHGNPAELTEEQITALRA